MISLSLVSLLLLLLLLLVNDATAFTAKKHDRKRPAFDVQKGVAAVKAETDVAPPQQSPAPGNHPAAAFGMHPAAAAAAATTAIVYQEFYDEDEDDELVGVTMAVVSCLLSLALGFGLGYGT